MWILENFKLYIYGLHICGSVFVENSDLGLWDGYVWFLHIVYH